MQCVELEKKQFDIWSKTLWDILYKNMSVIAPFGKTYEEAFHEWHQAVKIGLKKEQRKILLLKYKTDLIGFFQYYVNDNVFMIEEIQIMPQYQVTYGVIGILAKYLLSEIPEDTIYIDAYADNRNKTSQRIMKKLGMSRIRNEGNGLAYYRGYYEMARAHLQRKLPKYIRIKGEDACETNTKTCAMCRGFLFREDKIAIVHERKTGFYQIPGGGLEDGETLKQCCIREMLEETGYLVKVSEFPLVQIDEYYGEWKFEGYYFACEATGYKGRRLSEEETAKEAVLEWMTVEEALDIFGTYAKYKGKEPAKYGGFLREYEALKMYFHTLTKH